MRPTPRLRHLVAALAVAAIASACGPGSGGTGSGVAASLTAAGALAANVCASTIGPMLACTADGGVSITNAVGTGTAQVLYADLAGGGNVAVTVLGNSVKLHARCQRLSFTGDWGITTSGDARFFGSYLIETTGMEVPASLSVQAVAGGTGSLQAVLREADGRLVLGPVLLNTVAVPVAQPASCP